MIDEPQFDLWLSTRLVNEKFSSFGDYFAEFRVKNETIMSKYFEKFINNSIKLEVLCHDLNMFVFFYKSFIRLFDFILF
jgi:hypothetical protein